MKTITALVALESMILQGFLGTRIQAPKPESSPNEYEPDNGEACIANISPRERLKRLIGGVIPFVMALVILTWQISTDVDRLWRLPLFVLFVSAASGFFQWRDKT